MDPRDYGIIGESQAIQSVFQQACKIAISDSDVLLHGESGTGKELFSRLVHSLSKRHNRPFVALNCGALPTDIAESELFGHVQGAYTGALHPKQGLLNSASGGTCMLDEVGELKLDLQVKLLRFLDERKVRKVGGIELEPVDVRIIAVTNRDLAHEVGNGGFRDSLYYRLRRLEIILPPLRDRRDDIPLLIEYFLSKEFPSKKIESSAICRLMEYDWPGNVRELRNVVEEMAILSDGYIIDVDHLPKYVKEDLNHKHITTNNNNNNNHLHPTSLKEIIDSYEKQVIESTLEINNKNRNRTARMLRISKQALYKKLKKYQIQPVSA